MWGHLLGGCGWRVLSDACFYVDVLGFHRSHGSLSCCFSGFHNEGPSAPRAASQSPTLLAVQWTTGQVASPLLPQTCPARPRATEASLLQHLSDRLCFLLSAGESRD